MKYRVSLRVLSTPNTICSRGAAAGSEVAIPIMKTMLQLTTIAEALGFLDDLFEMKPEDVPEVSLGGELLELSIYVDGPDYHGSFPGEFARGLWEFQEAVYNAVAFALYGVDDLRKLTVEQRQDFEIVFEVREGSLDITGALEKFFTKLGEGFIAMDAKSKMITIIAVAAIFAGGYAGVHLIDSNADIRKAQIEAEVKMAADKAHVDQMNILAKAVSSTAQAKAFSDAAETGTKAIVKRSTGATEVKVGAVKFDEGDIEEVKKRAEKERSQAVIIVDDFVVVRVETRDNTTTKLILANAKYPEFSVVVQDEDFTEEQIVRLWTAIKARQKIRLEVNATYVRDAIKSAQVVNIA
ncbi:hypothetical protein PSP31120_03664 [Pandoraea sputorum]|nr:hypothetical protein PSP31120_03664 [Pandoraea sputorum]